MGAATALEPPARKPIRRVFSVDCAFTDGGVAIGKVRSAPATAPTNVRRFISESPQDNLEVQPYYASKEAPPLRRPTEVSRRTSINDCYVARCATTAVGRGRVITARGSQGEWLVAQVGLNSAGETVGDAGAQSRPRRRVGGLHGRSGLDWARIMASPSMSGLRPAFRRCPGCASRASGYRPGRAGSSRCAPAPTSSSESGSTPSRT